MDVELPPRGGRSEWSVAVNLTADRSSHWLGRGLPKVRRLLSRTRMAEDGRAMSHTVSTKPVRGALTTACVLSVTLSQGLRGGLTGWCACTA